MRNVEELIYYRKLMSGSGAVFQDELQDALAAVLNALLEGEEEE